MAIGLAAYARPQNPAFRPRLPMADGSPYPTDPGNGIMPQDLRLNSRGQSTDHYGNVLNNNGFQLQSGRPGYAGNPYDTNYAANNSQYQGILDSIPGQASPSQYGRVPTRTTGGAYGSNGDGFGYQRPQYANAAGMLDVAAHGPLNPYQGGQQQLPAGQAGYDQAPRGLEDYSRVNNVALKEKMAQQLPGQQYNPQTGVMGIDPRVMGLSELEVKRAGVTQRSPWGPAQTTDPSNPGYRSGGVVGMPGAGVAGIDKRIGIPMDKDDRYRNLGLTPPSERGEGMRSASSRARQDRLAQRGQPMGILDYIARQNPAMAMQMAQMNQRGAIAQGQLGLQDRQLQSRERIAVSDAEARGEIARGQTSRYAAQDELKFEEAARNSDAEAIAYRQAGKFKEAEEAERRSKGFRSRMGQGLQGVSPTNPGYSAPMLPPGAAGQIAASGIAGQNPGTAPPARGITAPVGQRGGPQRIPPNERKVIRETMGQDPQSVVQELQRRGFSGPALDEELNEIFGGGLAGILNNRTAQNPRGFQPFYGAFPFLSDPQNQKPAAPPSNPPRGFRDSLRGFVPGF